MATQFSIDEMTIEEKLDAMEALWADLSRHEQNVPVYEWQKGVLDEREGLIESGNASFSDWETAKTRINEEVS